MSVSTHLTPEPERRLWLILESMTRAVEWTDQKTAALTAFALAELVFANILTPPGPFRLLSLLSLSAALPLGVFAFSPLTGAPKWFDFLEPHRGRPTVDDCLITADDLAKYSHGELIGRLEKYLGGGITSTQYYEDIIGQIVVRARLATRKQRLFRIACVLVGLGQAGLFGQLIGR